MNADKILQSSFYCSKKEILGNEGIDVYIQNYPCLAMPNVLLTHLKRPQNVLTYSYSLHETTLLSQGKKISII